MAKIKLNFPITNSLGDHSMYKMHGVEKTILRGKGGPNRRQVRLYPQLEKMRNNGSEFSGASKMAGSIRRALYAVNHLADFNCSTSLTAIALGLRNYDVTSLHGQRRFLLSQYASMLQGFNLNKEIPFDKMVMASPAYKIFRDAYRAELSFCELFQESNLMNPKGLGYYNIIASLAIATDMVWTKNGYVPKNNDISFHPVQESTGWISTQQGLPPTTFNLQLPANNIIDETCTLILALGIDFGYATGNGEVQSVKYAGSAKILAVG